MAIMSKSYLSQTIILQTLQQLIDVYGQSVDKVIQGNVANIVFLKSTDDSMIDTLEKMSGTTHEALIEQKTITRDNERMLSKNEGRISYTMSTKERSVIQFNDMMFIPPRNSMVFRSGESPIWNRRTTILPMSWRLLKDTIMQPGVNEYSLQTVPTLSTALDFDIRKNQPDFYRMLTKRVDQAREVDYMRDRYMSVHNYSEDDMARLDPDVLSDEIMIAINEKLYGTGIDKNEKDDTPWGSRGYSSKEEWQEVVRQREVAKSNELVQVSTPNKELQQEVSVHKANEDEMNMKVYAGGRISKRMLVTQMGHASMQLGKVFAHAYDETKQHFKSNARYLYNPETETLRDAESSQIFIQNLSEADGKAFDEAAKSHDTRVFSEVDEVAEAGIGRFEVKEAFIKHLASLSSWSDIAGGRFEKEVARAYDKEMTLKE